MTRKTGHASVSLLSCSAGVLRCLGSFVYEKQIFLVKNRYFLIVSMKNVYSCIGMLIFCDLLCRKKHLEKSNIWFIFGVL